MFHRMSERCLVHWIITSPHYVEVGTQELWGQSRGSAATESKIVPWTQIDLKD